MAQEPEQVEVLSGTGGEEREPGSLLTLWQRRSERGRAVISAVAVLALGGAVAYAATSGGSPDAAASASQSRSSSSSSSPASPDSGPSSPWLSLTGDVAHGRTTVKDRETGQNAVRIWQLGTIERVDGDHVTVRSDDGVLWAWVVEAGTTVLADDTSASQTDALEEGATVYLAGSDASSGTRTATRVLSGVFFVHAQGGRESGLPPAPASESPS